MKTARLPDDADRRLLADLVEADWRLERMSPDALAAAERALSPEAEHDPAETLWTGGLP